MHPETGARLESFWSNGNIEEQAPAIYIRARKAVIVGTGGMHGSIPLRTMIDPSMVEPSIEYGPSALMGPLHMDGSGIVAGMKIGANLAGMMPELSALIRVADDIERAGHARFHRQHLPGTSLVPLRARQGHQHRRRGMGARDLREPGGPALLQ
jgi:hypothetical protein